MILAKNWRSYDNIPALSCWVLCGLLTLAGSVHASHNLAGQITAERINGNRYRITITTYTDPAPQNVDRCKADLEIWTCDGRQLTVLADIPRSNGPLSANPGQDCPRGVHDGVPVYQTVKRNIYVVEHTLPGQGCYELRYYDPLRRADIVNIQDPGNVTFYVETHLSIPNPIIGENHTPQLLNDPIDEACVNKLWTHNPGSFDPDGDSLAYSLMPSMQYRPDMGVPNPIPASNYRFPDDMAFGNSLFEIDPRTGILTWDAPRRAGVYNVAFRVDEYRNGLLLGYVVRDMVIVVKPCDNNPPVIIAPADTCVAAGDTIRIPYTAYDPDEEDSVYLELNNGAFGLNGPFNQELSNPATLSGEVVDPESALNPWPYSKLPVGTLNGIMSIDSIKGIIEWKTDCGNIRSRFYQVDFFAHDNIGYFNNPAMLTAHKVSTIRVIPPRPTGLKAEKAPGVIKLNWGASPCPNVVGYRIYRRIGSSGLSADSICCEVPPSEQGYALVAYNRGGQQTGFVDSLKGVGNFAQSELCYVVTAMFEDDDDGYDPNIESCGIEACISIQNDSLYITNDSVAISHPSMGEIFISWSKPDSIDPFFQGPFYYRLYRANNNQYPAVLIADRLRYEQDTTWLDRQLKTSLRSYSYRVELVDARGAALYAGPAHTASSVFLQTQGGMGFIDLTWTEYVPWRNGLYEVYRSDNGAAFQRVATVNGTGSRTHSYRDNGLNDSTEYCYFIRATGSYGLQGIKDPLINDSQHACDFARDDRPPCNPQIEALGNCAFEQHEVKVIKPSDPCAAGIEEVLVHYAPRREGPYTEVARFDYDAFSGDTTLYFPLKDGLNTIAGCYAVKARDEYGNESRLSEPYCTNFCPELTLGNVFSPNKDGQNDYFTPVRYRDVRLIDFRVYDRWGRMVHRNTQDIERLWEGDIQMTGKPASEGVYYFYIFYELFSIGGNTRREEKNWVMLLR